MASKDPRKNPKAQGPPSPRQAVKKRSTGSAATRAVNYLRDYDPFVKNK